MNTGTRIIEKIIAILLIIVMTMANFALAGKTAVSYAVDAFVTNNKNVEIKSYFIDGEGAQVANLDASINNKDLRLITEVTLKNDKGRGGYFKGTLYLSDANFKFKEGDSVNVYVGAGETKTYEKDIEYSSVNDLSVDYLSKESNISLKGSYINSKKQYEINGSSKVTVNWKSEDNSEARFSMRLLTSSINRVNDVNKRIVQILLTSRVLDNSYPVKNTQIELLHLRMAK